MEITYGLCSEIFDLLLLSDTTLQRRLEIEATEEKTNELLKKLETGEINLFDLPENERVLVDFDTLLNNFLFKEQWEKLSPNSWKHLKTGNYLHISTYVEKESEVIKTGNNKHGIQTTTLWEGFYINLWNPRKLGWGEMIHVKDRKFSTLEKTLIEQILNKNI